MKKELAIKENESLSSLGDPFLLIEKESTKAPYAQGLSTLSDLLERDKQREEDGFPRKIRIGRLVKPGHGGKDRIVIVPTTVEEKFVHDNRIHNDDNDDEYDDDDNDGDDSGENTGKPMGGAGSGEEGEVIGEEPLEGNEGTGTGGAGQGESGAHGIESSAYELGKILNEKFQLPNLKDKGKKKAISKYTYDLTDRNRGSGQILDKKATLRKIVETNIALGNLPDLDDIDPSKFLVSPNDKIFRILSKEKDYEAQALVFFIRDYSGSMTKKLTEIVTAQHLMIYSWLLYQYEKRVETKFILHDTEAKEVLDFYTYYSSTVAGGTQVSSAYKMVNKMIEEGSLHRDYNIYIFHGTDGDDWDARGDEALPELKKMITYCNRIGITIVENSYSSGSSSTMESYIDASGLLDTSPESIRLDVIPENSPEERLVEGIKNLLS